MTDHPGIALIDLSEDQEALDQALSVLGDDVMTLSELDGLLTAVSACPEAIAPEEWLPLLWNGEEIDEEALMGGPKVAEAVARILSRRMQIAALLEADEEPLEPIYSVDDASGEVLWEIWLGGFEQGMGLRVEAWEALCRRDEEAADALNLLTTIIFLAEGDEETKAELGPEKADALMAVAPAVIPQAVEVFARAGRRGSQRPVRSVKIGRNEPCACGSGKKFKKCCGAV